MKYIEMLFIYIFLGICFCIPIIFNAKVEAKARTAIRKLAPGDTIFITCTNDNPFIKMEKDTFIVKGVSGDYVLYKDLEGHINSCNMRVKMTSDRHTKVKFVKR